MEWEIHKGTLIDGSDAFDISDEVVNISNLKIEFTRARRHVITHPTIVIKNLNHDDWVGSYLFVKIDQEIRFVLFVRSLSYNNEAFTTSLDCWDILYKLKDVYLADFDVTFWSGYSPNATSEYRNSGSTQTHWITVAFLFRVMLHFVSGLDFSEISDLFYDVYTYFRGYFSGGSSTLLKIKHLGFGWDQLRNIGKTESDEPYYKTLTLLDVYQFISEVFNISAHVAPDGSGGWKYEIKTTQTFIAMPEIIGKYYPKHLEKYEGLKVSVERLSTFNQYTSFESGDFYSENDATATQGNVKVANLSYPKSMFVGRIYNGMINDLDLYDGRTFCESVRLKRENDYINKHKEVTGEVSQIYTNKALVVDFNIPISTKLTILEEV